MHPSICSRRDFLRIAGKAGLGALAAASGGKAYAANKHPDAASGPSILPMRPFGKTGIQVSTLALGGSQNLLNKQILLKQALKLGVSYWDTAYIYAGGKSEEGIGKYFSKFPEDRPHVFLSSKAPSADPAQMTRYLQTSLERLKTDYLDLFLMHKLSRLDDIDLKAVKSWAQNAKSKGLIRFFGFSTHKNMEKCLLQGASLGWIDGILTSYNYRLMQSDAMQKAVDACHKAGIGLTAMKTQAPFIANFYAEIGRENDAALSAADQFISKGYSIHQAKLKAVWDNPHIASICSEMPNMTILQANVAAAAGQPKLSKTDQQALRSYAKETSCGYCAGCADRCESAQEQSVPISDIMRCLMYHYGYDNPEMARNTFKELSIAQEALVHGNFSQAEHHCPHKIPIALMMRTAAKLFG
jgi:predicted aldo/keto reductase-like oxidoreductase